MLQRIMFKSINLAYCWTLKQPNTEHSVSTYLMSQKDEKEGGSGRGSEEEEAEEEDRRGGRERGREEEEGSRKAGRKM